VTDLPAKYTIGLRAGTHTVTHNLSSTDVIVEGAAGWHVVDANTICVTLFQSTTIRVLA
jgi:hypothetical protein